MKRLSTLLYSLLLVFLLVVGAVLALLLTTLAAAAQPHQPTAASLTLPQVIELTLAQSSVAKQVQTNRETSLWQYRSFRADYKPQLALEGTLPNYSRTITPVTQQDGSTAFRYVRINNSYLGTTVSQNIGLTGGKVTIGSYLQRFDNFEGNRQRLYNSNPISLGLTQPIGGFNALVWAKRIEPLRFEESQRQYVEERETIARRVTELYFDVLQQQVNAAVARQNREASQDLLRMGREKDKLGRISENDLLLLEQNLLNAQQAEVQATVDAQNAALQLKGYTGLTVDAAHALAVPAAAATLAVNPDDALAHARQYRREPLSFRRRLLEAERGVAQAKGSTGLQASLTASFGLTSSADDLMNSYVNPNNQQQVRLGFAMPIVDWGKTRAVVKTAQLSRQQVQYTVEQEQLTFEQQVLSQAAQVAALGQQLALAARADSLAQRRYTITRATYQVGRISLTDLNIAQQDKDRATRAYIAALRACWVAYYQLRTLTLYDFERGQPLLAAQ
ncbi:TolC family protein [Hymenobacter busanensis]|uniref:TolC family protein n=1 Tax=Hymenobacter busanensis TaxID=2607656 RepID=A0A7L4ZWY0_9BACT|nr:TolC family protein [Hymenobacter busanensis]KAA9333312.1 TolC family protein [Hymenobacter busanensis]QHJ08009.1 TolC family protein [Hymenobacter busanensis]